VRKATYANARRFNGTVVLNNKIFKGGYQQLPDNEAGIAHMAFVKGSIIETEYGIRPGDSILSISTKTFINANTIRDDDPKDDPLFTQPEIEPKFPQANGGWQAFLSKNLDVAVPANKGAKAGAYKVVVGFIVDVDGKLYDIKPMTRLGYGMEEEVVRLLKLSPDWSPALQNGKRVTAYKKQAVTFVIDDAKTNG